MHVPLLFSLFFATLSLALQDVNARQAATTPPPSPFSGNAAQLISLYIPTSVQSLLYSVYTSVEQTTGDPASIIESAFTATVAPSWLNAVPTEYRSNIEALSTAISSLRVAATGGVGATESPPPTASAVSVSGSSSGATEVTGSVTSSVPVRTPAILSSFDWGDAASASSEGFGVPTNVPLMGAGVMGFVGAVLVL